MSGWTRGCNEVNDVGREGGKEKGREKGKVEKREREEGEKGV